LIDLPLPTVDRGFILLAPFGGKRGREGPCFLAELERKTNSGTKERNNGFSDSLSQQQQQQHHQQQSLSLIIFNFR
jgi:hypothetical protein